jgi:hypothetical protein
MRAKKLLKYLKNRKNRSYSIDNKEHQLEQMKCSEEQIQEPIPIGRKKRTRATAN